MSEHPTHDDVPQLEADETVPPRPEEEVADVARSEPRPGTDESAASQVGG